MNSTSSSTAARRPVILCIDDADIALRVRKLLLGSEGYNVLTANSGEDGLEGTETGSSDSHHFGGNREAPRPGVCGWVPG